MRIVPTGVWLWLALIASSGLAQNPPLVPLPELNLHPERVEPELPDDVRAVHLEALVVLRELYAVLRAALIHEPDQTRINEVMRARRAVVSAQQAVANEPDAERLGELREAIEGARKLLRSWYVVARLRAPTGRASPG